MFSGLCVFVPLIRDAFRTLGFGGHANTVVTTATDWRSHRSSAFFEHLMFSYLSALQIF